MSNAPDHFEIIVLPPGVKKVSIQKDTKVSNASKFIIQREDHTLGNLLRYQLLSHKSVIFAGYRVAHPLKPEIEIRLQTRKESTPARALNESLYSLIVDLGQLRNQFESEVQRVKRENASALGKSSSSQQSGTTSTSVW